MRCKKFTKHWKIEPLDMEDAPQTFFQNHEQIKEDGKGAYKLRSRNDKIHAEMTDLALKLNTKLISSKIANRVFLVVKDFGISVCLIN